MAISVASVVLALGTGPWSASAVEEAPAPPPDAESAADTPASTTTTAPTTTAPPVTTTTVPATTTTTEPPAAPPATATTEAPPSTSTTMSPPPDASPPAARSGPAPASAPPPPAPEDPGERSPVVPGSPAAPPLAVGPLPVEEPLPPAGGDDSEAPASDVGPFPPELQALRDSVARTGSSNSQALIDALAPLGRYGVSPEEAAVVGFGRFPVAGKASYSHDWWFPRFGPGWRLHEGTDIFAAMGTPVRAPAGGTARIRNGDLGGLSVYVIEPDGTYYYLAHLAATAPDLVDGTPVRTGQVVGFVGDSGNARGGSPHVHFEVHPGGGGPVDPKPVLDQFLADAVAGAPAVVDAYAEASRAAGSRKLPPRLPEPRAARLPLADAPRSALLWASAASPAGGALRLAQAEALRAAATVEQNRRVAAQSSEDHRTAAALHAWLAPLVPPALTPFLK